MELDNILNYLGCDAEIYLNKELESVFKNMPETEELFLMRIGNTLWDFVRKRTGKDCPCCMSDELNYVLAETEKGKRLDRVLRWKEMGRRKSENISYK